jgi:hypothetical protein
MIVSD